MPYPVKLRRAGCVKPQGQLPRPLGTLFSIAVPASAPDVVPCVPHDASTQRVRVMVNRWRSRMHHATSYSKGWQHLPLADVTHIVVASEDIPRLDARVERHAILPAPLPMVSGKTVFLFLICLPLALPAPRLARHSLVHDILPARAALSHKHGPTSAPLRAVRPAAIETEPAADHAVEQLNRQLHGPPNLRQLPHKGQKV